jgi:CHAT domain/SMODS-associated and fused to various effectors sensor domain
MRDRLRCGRDYLSAHTRNHAIKESEVSITQEAQCILILDLASDNPISERSIEPFLPPSTNRRIYRVTGHGAEPAPHGGAPNRRGWRDWTAAIDRMLAQARADLGEDGDIAHYYLAGRAALPILAYLGVRLAKQARVTMINQRSDGPWDVVPFQQPPGVAASEPDRERFFDVVRGLRRDDPYEGNGRVAVFVSTQRDLEEKALRDFASSLDTSLAGIVVLRASPRGDSAHQALRLLGAEDGPRAARELVEHFTAIPDCYPHSSGLIVYIAGPATLGAMVGRAMNPRIHSPVWLPNFRKPGYKPAVEIPWPLVSGGKPSILVLVANTPDADGDRLDSDGELRDMLDTLQKQMSAKRCELRLCPAVRERDLMDALRDFKPHLLHFIGHGDERGLYLTGDDGSERFVHGDELRDMLASSRVEDLHLVVFNACRSHVQAKDVSALVDCAIGTNVDVPDESAIRFARRLYDDLVRGCSVAHAFARASSESRAGTGDTRKIFELHHRDVFDPEQLVFFSPAARDD